MSFNTKLERLAQDLVEALTQRLASVSYPEPVLKKYDANGDVYLEVTKSAALDAVIKFETLAAPASGSLDAVTGLAQRVFTPHVIKVGFDTGAKASGTATLANVLAGTTVTINGVVFTAVAGAAGANEFTIAGDDTADAASLVTAINASVTAGVAGVVTATSALGVVTITAVEAGLTGNSITLATSAGTVTLSGAKLTGGTSSYPDTTLKYTVVAEVVRKAAETRFYEKAGLVLADLASETNFVTVYRNKDWGLLDQQ